MLPAMLLSRPLKVADVYALGSDLGTSHDDAFENARDAKVTASRCLPFTVGDIYTIKIICATRAREREGSACMTPRRYLSTCGFIFSRQRARRGSKRACRPWFTYFAE